MDWHTNIAIYFVFKNFNEGDKYIKYLVQDNMITWQVLLAEDITESPWRNLEKNSTHGAIFLCDQEAATQTWGLSIYIVYFHNFRITLNPLSTSTLTWKIVIYRTQLSHHEFDQGLKVFHHKTVTNHTWSSVWTELM